MISFFTLNKTKEIKMSKENHVPYFVTTPPPNFRKNSSNMMTIGMNRNIPTYNSKPATEYISDANISRHPNIRQHQNVRTPNGTYVGSSSSTRLGLSPSQNDNARSAIGIKSPVNVVSPAGYNSYDMENERMHTKSSGQVQYTRTPTGQTNISRSIDISPRYKAATPIVSQQQGLRTPTSPAGMNQQSTRSTSGKNQNSQVNLQYDSPLPGTQNKRYYSMSVPPPTVPSPTVPPPTVLPPTVPSSYIPRQYLRPGGQAVQNNPLGAERTIPSYTGTSTENNISSHTSTNLGTDRRMSLYSSNGSEPKIAAYVGSTPMEHSMQMFYDNQASYYNRGAVMQPPLPEQPPPSKPPLPKERPPPDIIENKPQHMNQSRSLSDYTAGHTTTPNQDVMWSYTNGAVYYSSTALPYTNVPPPSTSATHYQQPIHCTPPAPQPYSTPYQPTVAVQGGYVPRSNYYKRRPENDPDSHRKNNKKRKKPLSQNISHRKDWSVADAKRAIDVEKECNKRARSQSLIIKFPDLELNRDIVSQFHRSIEGVHFQQPSTPRFCFVTLASTAAPEEVIKELNRVKFGHGYLTAEFKKDREDDLNLGPEDIDPLTLYVGNLAQEVTKDDMVRTYPMTKRIDIGYAKKMKYTRYAFVSFKTVDDAIEAFKKTHSTQMHSKSLIVRFRRLHGTVGMPGEPKPQPPQKSLEYQTRTNSFSEDTEETEEVQPAPWDMLDVSSWEADARDRIKPEPLEILSDDEEPSEEICYDDDDNDNNNRIDEVPEVKPKIKVATPFLPGSLEVAFSMHKPLRIDNMKREQVVEESSNESNANVALQHHNNPNEKLNNFNHADSPTVIKSSLPIILDKSTQNNIQSGTLSASGSSSLNRDEGSCESVNPSTAKNTVTQQRPENEIVPVPMPMIDRKPVTDPITGTVLPIKKEISDSTITNYDQLMSLERRISSYYRPIEQLKEEFTEDETKDAESCQNVVETQTDCTTLGNDEESLENPSEGANNEAVVEQHPETVMDNNSSTNTDVEYVEETSGFGCKTQLPFRVKDEPTEDTYERKRSAILDEAEVRGEVKREPNDEDDDDANDSDDSGDRMDFDKMISKMNQSRTKAD